MSHVQSQEDYYGQRLSKLQEELREAQAKNELYESALAELSASLSIKHVLVDLRLSQTAIEALRQSLDGLQTRST